MGWCARRKRKINEALLLCQSIQSSLRSLTFYSEGFERTACTAYRIQRDLRASLFSFESLALRSRASPARSGALLLKIDRWSSRAVQAGVRERVGAVCNW
jgi:hypothetical protein